MAVTGEHRAQPGTQTRMAVPFTWRDIPVLSPTISMHSSLEWPFILGGALNNLI